MKIVRLACLLVAVLAVSRQAAFAQDAPAAGVMVGINQSYFASSPKNDTDKKIGVMIGAFGILRRDKNFRILPEVQFSQRRVDVAFGSTKASFSTAYLNLGVMTRLNLFKGLYTTQGGQFSFPLRSEMELASGSADIKDNVQWDFSIPAGIGRQFGRVGIEGRWDSGLKRVEKAPLGNFIKRNRAITIFGYIGF